MLKEEVLNTIKEYNLISNGDKLVLGVSGGPDSISMLNILYELKQEKEFDFDFVVAHVNHGIRANAVIDEEFVKGFCEKRDIPFCCLNINLKELSKETGRGLEETGRIERYKFFDEVCLKTDSNKVAIAHNANDNVETIIMNILRGSGLSGLKGIEAINGKYIRPLIKSNREEIEKYCDENKLNPRHDESNDENIYTRNKIRNIVIPYIKENLNPNILESISRLSDIAKDDLNYLDKMTEKAYNSMLIEEKCLNDNVYKDSNEATIILDLKKFNEEDKTIQKRVILHSISKIFGSTQGIEKIHIEDIIKLCNKNIGNKFLTPNKKTKVEIKSKKIFIKELK